MADYNQGYRSGKAMEAEMNGGYAKGGKVAVKHMPKPTVKIAIRPAAQVPMPMPGPMGPPAGLGAVAPPQMPGMAKGGKVSAAKAMQPKPEPDVGVELNPVVKVKAHVRKFANGGAVKKNWIADATKNKGGLHKSLGVPAGEKIPAKKMAAAASKSGKVGKQARLAETLKGLHKAKGGAVHDDAKQDMAMLKAKVKPSALKAKGGKVKSGKGK